MLEKKLEFFAKETSAFRRAIDVTADDAKADKSKLEIALARLKVINARYESSIRDLEDLFIQDRWGDSIETINNTPEESRTLIDLANTVIIKMTLKLESASEIQQNEALSLPSGKTKTSKHSRPIRSLSYNTSTSSVRAKAFAELATTNKQAEFDVLIAEKEKARKECEAQDELRKATERVKHDHDMAILKARTLKTVASAKLDAIEQPVDDENIAIRKQTVKHEDASERTQMWLGDQND